jgi:hypothetical protein
VVRVVRIVVLLALLALPLAVTPSASALDLCDAPECQPPPVEQNSPFEFQLVADEGCVPYRFSLSSGSLPPGVSLTEDGKLEGTPTQAGMFDFYVALDDNSGPTNPACLILSKESQGHIRLTVLPDLYVATTSVPAAVAGRPYSVTLEAANPEVGWPLLWDVTAGTLPAGLSLAVNGVLSGTPTGPDTQTVTVRVREPFRRSGERQLTVAVAAALTASSSSPGLTEVGVRYSGRATASGGTAPFTWTVTGGALPAGLALDPASGAIGGIATSPGSFSAQLGVSDSGGQTAGVPLTIRVASRISIATGRLPRAAPGVAYRTRLASTGGVGPRRWTVVRGKLPQGIALGTTTGVLSGVARRAGTSSLRIRVDDRLGGTATRTFRLVVR